MSMLDYFKFSLKLFDSYYSVEVRKLNLSNDCIIIIFVIVVYSSFFFCNEFYIFLTEL